QGREQEDAETERLQHEAEPPHLHGHQQRQAEQQGAAEGAGQVAGVGELPLALEGEADLHGYGNACAALRLPGRRRQSMRAKRRSPRITAVTRPSERSKRSGSGGSAGPSAWANRSGAAGSIVCSTAPKRARTASPSDRMTRSPRRGWR